MKDGCWLSSHPVNDAIIMTIMPSIRKAPLYTTIYVHNMCVHFLLVQHRPSHINDICRDIILYHCVKMHVLKMETLETSSAESLKESLISGPNWGSNPGLSECQSDTLTTEPLVSGDRGVRD